MSGTDIQLVSGMSVT